jgi:hypothetical protein
MYQTNEQNEYFIIKKYKTMKTKILIILGLLFAQNNFAQISIFDPGQEYADRMNS